MGASSTKNQADCKEEVQKAKNEQSKVRQPRDGQQVEVPVRAKDEVEQTQAEVQRNCTKTVQVQAKNEQAEVKQDNDEQTEFQQYSTDEVKRVEDEQAEVKQPKEAEEVVRKAQPTQKDTPRTLEFDQIIDERLELTNAKKSQIKQNLRQVRSLKVLVMGKTGAGKSSLLNYVFGLSLFEVGREKKKRKTSELTTKTVTNACGTSIIVWDSPGLQDGTENEREYLIQMKKQCFSFGKAVDLILYCISMEDQRTDLPRHESAIEKYTKFFGPGIWKNTLFVLTRANNYVDLLEEQRVQNIQEKFEQRIQDWRVGIYEALQRLNVSQKMLDNIQVIPAGHNSELELPGCPNWVSRVWSEALRVSRKSGKCAMLRMELERGFASDIFLKFHDSPEKRKIVLTDDVKKALKDIISSGSKLGVVTLIGTGTGAASGAAILGIPSFGAAAGPGAVIGGLIGGGIAFGLWALIAATNRDTYDDTQ